MGLNILVTGAGGFIGRHLVAALKLRGFRVIQAVRSAVASGAGSGSDVVVIGDIGSGPDWNPLLKDVDVVVHLAACVHRAGGARESADEYRRINVAATETLARRAAASGVKRFVYVSSIGVNGDGSGPKAVTEEDRPRPRSRYAVSKWEAEQALRKIAAETEFEVVILRPPLVYGPGNPGNFRRLLKLVAAGVPLPLGSVDNRRSLVYVGNLVDALVLCSTHPAAAGNTFLVRDGDDVSTPELVRRLAALMGRKPRLVVFPPWLLRMAGGISGKSAQVVSLVDSLVIDDSRIRATLGWRPPCTLDAGLRETVRWFQQ